MPAFRELTAKRQEERRRLNDLRAAISEIGVPVVTHVPTPSSTDDLVARRFLHDTEIAVEKIDADTFEKVKAIVVEHLGLAFKSVTFERCIAAAREDVEHEVQTIDAMNEAFESEGWTRLPFDPEPFFKVRRETAERLRAIRMRHRAFRDIRGRRRPARPLVVSRRPSRRREPRCRAVCATVTRAHGPPGRPPRDPDDDLAARRRAGVSAWGGGR